MKETTEVLREKEREGKKIGEQLCCASYRRGQGNFCCKIDLNNQSLVGFFRGASAS